VPKAETQQDVKIDWGSDASGQVVARKSWSEYHGFIGFFTSKSQTDCPSLRIKVELLNTCHRTFVGFRLILDSYGFYRAIENL
jgi:hypothetical protein